MIKYRNDDDADLVFLTPGCFLHPWNTLFVVRNLLLITTIVGMEKFNKKKKINKTLIEKKNYKLIAFVVKNNL